MCDSKKEIIKYRVPFVPLSTKRERIVSCEKERLTTKYSQGFECDCWISVIFMYHTKVTQNSLKFILQSNPSKFIYFLILKTFCTL